MKILLTGSSGFLGRIIYSELASEHKVITLSRTNADIMGDLTMKALDVPDVDLVIHCAGKAHSIPTTEREREEFFEVNTTGTLNLLKSIDLTKGMPPKIVFISTVAVYGCETGVMIDEQQPLKAIDPYGRSKVDAERLISEWCRSKGTVCTILRLPLLAGTYPPGNLASMIKGIQKGYYFDVGGGRARKSIVLAEDIAKVIPRVAEIGGTYNITDRHHPSFSELSFYIAKQLGKSKPWNIPHLLAVLIAKIGDAIGEKSPINSNKLRKITNDLTFDDQKAVDAFGWNPTPVLKGFNIR